MQNYSPPPKSESRLRNTRVLVIFVWVGLSACDSVTPVDTDVSNGGFFEVDGLSISRDGDYASKGPLESRSPFRCIIAVLDNTAEADSFVYRYGRFDLHFDHEIEQRASGKGVWRYRMPVEGDESRMARAIDCIVPTSGETTRMMSRLVGLEKTSDARAVPAPSQHLLATGIETSGTTSHSLSGDVPNSDGYICPPAYNWLDADMKYCVDAAGNISLPDVMVFEDPWPPGGGGDPGCWGDCDYDNCDHPAEFCFEDGQGGGFPPMPRDPCQEPDPPAWCNNRCEIGDDLVDRRSFQEEAERLFELSYGENMPLPQDQRNEYATWVYELPGGGLHFEEMSATATSCTMSATSPPTAEYNLIAILHTHPFVDREIITDPRCLAVRDPLPEGYNYKYDSANASRKDSGVAIQFGVPIYILDAEVIRKVTTDGLISPPIDRCGY